MIVSGQKYFGGATTRTRGGMMVKRYNASHDIQVDALPPGRRSSVSGRYQYEDETGTTLYNVDLF